MVAVFKFLKAFSTLCFGYRYKNVAMFFAIKRKQGKLKNKLRKNLKNDSLM